MNKSGILTEIASAVKQNDGTAEELIIKVQGIAFECLKEKCIFLDNMSVSDMESMTKDQFSNVLSCTFSQPIIRRMQSEMLISLEEQLVELEKLIDDEEENKEECNSYYTNFWHNLWKITEYGIRLNENDGNNPKIKRVSEELHRLFIKGNLSDREI